MTKFFVTIIFLLLAVCGYSQNQVIELCRENTTFTYYTIGPTDCEWKWEVLFDDKVIQESNLDHVKVTFNKPGSYIIKASATNSICTSYTEVYTVLAEDCRMPLVSIPNAFTPNNFAGNNVFKVKTSNISLIHIWIFDRWGKAMFETQNPDEGWDGLNTPMGVYVCYVEFTDVHGMRSQKIQTVTLYR